MIHQKKTFITSHLRYHSLLLRAEDNVLTPSTLQVSSTLHNIISPMWQAMLVVHQQVEKIRGEDRGVSWQESFMRVPVVLEDSLANFLEDDFFGE